MIADPPFVAGGVHLAVAVTAPPTAPATAVPMTGAPGTVDGVTVLDGVDNAPRPADVTARTRKLYAVPLASPALAGMILALTAALVAIVPGRQAVATGPGSSTSQHDVGPTGPPTR